MRRSCPASGSHGASVPSLPGAAVAGPSLLGVPGHCSDGALCPPAARKEPAVAGAKRLVRTSTVPSRPRWTGLGVATRGPVPGIFCPRERRGSSSASVCLTRCSPACPEEGGVPGLDVILLLVTLRSGAPPDCCRPCLPWMTDPPPWLVAPLCPPSMPAGPCPAARTLQ